ncbi:MAG TPA: hypothetical protein VFD32_00390 [Dehalococcoidia bacterium]|nr:hypothetical protein [Dehalococcoidia bacterium]
MVSSTNRSDSGEHNTTTRKGRRIGHAARVLASVGAGLALVGVLGAGAVFGARHTTPGHQPHFAGQVVDNHVQPPGTAAASSPSSQAPVLATVYLAHSQAQADLAQAAISVAEAERMKIGGTVPEAQIVLVHSPAEADTWLNQLADENALRSSLGLSEIELVDLR